MCVGQSCSVILVMFSPFLISQYIGSFLTKISLASLLSYQGSIILGKGIYTSGPGYWNVYPYCCSPSIGLYRNITEVSYEKRPFGHQIGLGELNSESKSKSKSKSKVKLEVEVEGKYRFFLITISDILVALLQFDVFILRVNGPYGYFRHFVQLRLKTYANHTPNSYGNQYGIVCVHVLCPPGVVQTALRERAATWQQNQPPGINDPLSYAKFGS